MLADATFSVDLDLHISSAVRRTVSPAWTVLSSLVSQLPMCTRHLRLHLQMCQYWPCDFKQKIVASGRWNEILGPLLARRGHLKVQLSLSGTGSDGGWTAPCDVRRNSLTVMDHVSTTFKPWGIPSESHVSVMLVEELMVSR